MVSIRRRERGNIARIAVLTLGFLAVILLLKRHFSSLVPRYRITLPIHPEWFPSPLKHVLPRQRPLKLPAIQHQFPKAEAPAVKAIREARLRDVRETFEHAWEGYKQNAWAQDELRPVSGKYYNSFCGLAASMVDALDTLWIMDLKEDFEMAVEELRHTNFTHFECQINTFEMTIRHLGGMLAAYDISDGKYTILLEKAVELGEVLYTAFDTKYRMPTPAYTWSATNPNATDHLASQSIVLAVLGSLSLEFTRLAQITGNQKYFDAIQRVMNQLEMWQSETSLPGMWPTYVDTTFVGDLHLGSPWGLDDELYTLGAMSDSTYEYLPKQFMLLGGLAPQYRRMYEKFADTAKPLLLFRPMTIGDKDILFSGNYRSGATHIETEVQHLGCFAGGMFAIAGKIFSRPEDVEDGRRLADGCVWAYSNTASGIMPETFRAAPCRNRTSCKWDQKQWFHTFSYTEDDERQAQKLVEQRKLSPGFIEILDNRYLLRPEAIESVFVMYRITGDAYWVEAGWTMFKAIQAHTTTPFGHSAIDDVTSSVPIKLDQMESFWFAETLKYFYLLFSDPGVVDLDEWVLNTEAHPLRRPR